ncbi:antibiotic biosynthesis monooxygenase family protein [Nitrincola sp. MINF-07-Sa-05]|uniref:antibiotic biosynthesis monooxygenase family protein n=1 Tax=Nitrincola salilacus TaxID=3400273 RepID=UPI00391817E0
MIRVMIERHIALDLDEHYDRVASETLQKAMSAHGFISGEALRDIDDPMHRLVIANFRNAHDWQIWAQSEARKDMMKQMSLLLEQEEKITLFEY